MRFHGLNEKRVVEIEKILNRFEIPYLADRDEEAITSFLAQEENSNIDPKNVSIMMLEIPDSVVEEIPSEAKRFLLKQNIILDNTLFSGADINLHTPDPKPVVEKYVIWFMVAIIIFCLIGIIISI